MTDNKHAHHQHHPPYSPPSSAEHPSLKRCKLSYWLLGVGSLMWLLLRSGTNPRRMTYPCQRIAAANSAGFLAYLAALLGSATLLRRLKASFSPARLLLLAVGLLLTASLQGSVATQPTPLLADSPDLPAWTSPSAISDVFVISDVPAPPYSLDGGVVPGVVPADEALHDDGVDALVNLMEAHQDFFYKTDAHPGGLFGSDDVIVIKINNQWNWRYGTNTDVVKGVIYRLVQHPDGFDGAVIIAENTQAYNDNWYDQGSRNNSQFENQSYLDVALAFARQGYHVCIADWTRLRTSLVNDYDLGDNADGYVLEDADDTPEEQGRKRLSYPKFQTDCNGRHLSISMKQGLWDGSFDNTRLKMINLPVLKRHLTAWATIAVKNYLGFVTLYDDIGRWSGVSEMHCWLLGPNDNTHACPPYSAAYGLVARQMARVRRADLNIVDAIWVNPESNLSGSSVRLDVLLASRDPFAIDYYASDYILGPLIQQVYPDIHYEWAMASSRDGWFRNIQMRNVARLRTEGITDTINMDDGMTVAEELAQFNVYVAGAGDPLTPSLTLLTPNGSEAWEVGSQQQIQWSSTRLAGDVRLEYSDDGFASANVITSSTPNDGAYTWTVPNALSDSVLLRVSSGLTAAISDTSDAPFTIAGPHALEDSFKRVNHVNPQGGGTVTYTIALYEEISATLTFSDTIPALLTYVPGSASIKPGSKGPLSITTGIYWSGPVTGTQPVTITFQAQAPVTSTTWAVVNRAWVSRNGAAPIERTATFFLNGFQTYLPWVAKGTRGSGS